MNQIQQIKKPTPNHCPIQFDSELSCRNSYFAKSAKSLFMAFGTYFDHLLIAGPISLSHLTHSRRFWTRHQITRTRSQSPFSLRPTLGLISLEPSAATKSLHRLVMAMNHGSNNKMIFIILNCSLASAGWLAGELLINSGQIWWLLECGWCLVEIRVLLANLPQNL